MSNELDVLLTNDNKSIMCVVVVVIDHHVGNNSFNMILAKTVDPNKHQYFDTKLYQPSLAYYGGGPGAVVKAACLESEIAGSNPTLTFQF